ncbi:MarR family transcriptional regulator [Alloalcanivorax xenomutans]|uniref:MarR family winged helix-turn-helix transcriptional regulator n=1 Tax=Alloalcanivorax xenomutans TaxID=1094342 RepID=UPI002934E3E5|nr:MarR family transcriptional regulator [Alloalcanivorax xenomutans]WOD27680.1 MarR family transcriptional regulator [Alloalcanivorax xenomutans]
MRELIQAAKAASRVFDQLFAEAVEPLGLPAVQAEVVLLLYEKGPLTATVLSELTRVRPGNLTRIIDRLAFEGWVERSANPEDLRRANILLTAKGEDTAHQIQKLQQPILDWGKAHVGEQELRQAIRTLWRLAKSQLT